MLVNIFHRRRSAPTASPLRVFVWDIEHQHDTGRRVTEIVKSNIWKAVFPENGLQTLVQAITLYADHILCRGILLGSGQFV